MAKFADYPPAASIQCRYKTTNLSGSNLLTTAKDAALAKAQISMLGRFEAMASYDYLDSN